MASAAQVKHQKAFKAASKHCTHDRGPREKYTTCMSHQLGGLGGAKKKGKKRGGHKGHRRHRARG